MLWINGLTESLTKKRGKMEDKVTKEEKEIIPMNEDLYHQLDITELEERLEFGVLWGCEPETCGTYNCPARGS